MPASARVWDARDEAPADAVVATDTASADAIATTASMHFSVRLGPRWKI